MKIILAADTQAFYFDAPLSHRLSVMRIILFHYSYDIKFSLKIFSVIVCG